MLEWSFVWMYIRSSSFIFSFNFYKRILFIWTLVFNGTTWNVIEECFALISSTNTLNKYKWYFHKSIYIILPRISFSPSTQECIKPDLLYCYLFHSYIIVFFKGIIIKWQYFNNSTINVTSKYIPQYCIE